VGKLKYKISFTKQEILKKISKDKDNLIEKKHVIAVLIRINSLKQIKIENEYISI